MDEMIMKTFPSCKEEALAMLYVQTLDLSNATPEELLDMYDDAYERIYRQSQRKYDSRKEWI